jgi:predicted nucleic acid-binding protein
MRYVFVDTWGWCALVNRAQTEHQKVAVLFQELMDKAVILLTTNFVRDESYTLIRTRIHHKAAIEFHNLIAVLIRDQYVHLVQVTPEIEQDAWTIFERYDDKDFSYTDCTSFVVMQRFNITQAITDDHHFRQMGFQTRP